MKIGILAAPNKDGSLRRETERLATEIVNLGHKPEVIDYTRLAIGSNPTSRYTLIGHHAPHADIDMVIPYCDTHVLAGERVLRTLLHEGIPSTITPAEITTARNKLFAQMAFAKHDIPHPLSLAPGNQLPEDIHPFIDIVEPDRKEPIVVKLLFGTEGDGVWLKNRRQAAQLARELGEKSLPFMFQQRIAPLPGEETPSDKGIMVCQGRVIAAFKRTAQKGEFRANLAKGAVGTSYVPSNQEASMALKVSKVLGIPFGRLDIIDSSDGPLAVEFNVFPGFKIEQITGVNIARACVEHSLSIASKSAAIRTSLRFAH